MRRHFLLFFLVLFLSGCAAYKIQHGLEPHNKGYVASRDGYAILEYTIGKDNDVPQSVELARERFKTRRKIVEHYYKKMGYIENRFKMLFIDPAIMFVKLTSGAFRLPFIAISDYKYEHNPKYKEKVKKIEEQKDAAEEARIIKLKSELGSYIQTRLASERTTLIETQPTQVTLEKKEVLSESPTSTLKAEEEVKEEKIKPSAEELPLTAEAPPQQVIVEEKEAETEKPEPAVERPVQVSRQEKITEALELQQLNKEISKQKKRQTQLYALQPKAVILAKPAKGFSPLTVHFNAAKSRSPYGKIIYYSWDFGDTDTSKKANVANTYYSGSSEPEHFTATLTVGDDKGNSATTSIVIEVLNK